MIFND